MIVIVKEKVPDGKMVCMEVETNNNKTTKVKITGDFFLHPEEAIEKLEGSLTGIQINEDVKPRIENALTEAKMIGAAPEDIARIFKKAVSCGE